MQSRCQYAKCLHITAFHLVHHAAILYWLQAAAVLVGAVLLTTGTASADSPEPWMWLFQARDLGCLLWGWGSVSQQSSVSFFCLTPYALLAILANLNRYSWCDCDSLHN